MADDDWENDDFVPQLPALSSAKRFDDEEDQAEVDPVVAPKVLTAAEQARRAQKIAEEEERLATSLKFALLEGETAGERKARERRQLEEADHALTEELMGGGKASAGASSAAGAGSAKSSSGGEVKKVASLGSASSGGLASIPLSTKQDHTNFGITCSKKLAESTPIYVCAYFKSLLERLPPKMTTESLDDILSVLQRVRDEKKKVEGEVAKTTTQKKSKKEILAAEKKHNAIFGGASRDDDLDAYSALEDSFM